MKADGQTDSDNNVTADTAERKTSDDEFGQQMSFTDKKNPYED